MLPFQIQPGPTVKKTVLKVIQDKNVGPQIPGRESLMKWSIGSSCAGRHQRCNGNKNRVDDADGGDGVSRLALSVAALFLACRGGIWSLRSSASTSISVLHPKLPLPRHCVSLRACVCPRGSLSMISAGCFSMARCLCSCFSREFSPPLNSLCRTSVWLLSDVAP